MKKNQEWLDLMLEAKEIGLSVEEVRIFLGKGYGHNEEAEIQAFEKGRG